MTFANVGTIGVIPGKRDELIAILTRQNDELVESGCLLYEVGTNDEEPNTVFITELWESPEVHQASLQLADVCSAIAEAMRETSSTTAIAGLTSHRTIANRSKSTLNVSRLYVHCFTGRPGAYSSVSWRNPRPTRSSAASLVIQVLCPDAPFRQA